MASKGMRRLANDHANLHKHGLPPNYLFPPSPFDSHSDLTALSLLLAGPDNTPYATGIFHLDLRMEPGGYPTKPPTATFRTKIFHPNVDPSTGAVCVDTLKRDWKPELTLRDVLVTISCLLVCPNPASALNAEAGKLMEEDFSFFERRAAMWAKMYAAIPASLKDAVNEAKIRVIGESQPPATQTISKGKKRLEPMASEQITSEIENTPSIGQRHAALQQTPRPNPSLHAGPPPQPPSASLPRFHNSLLPSAARAPEADPFHAAFAMPWLDWLAFLPRAVPVPPFKRARAGGPRGEVRRGIFRL